MKKEQALLHLAAQHATTRHSVALEKAGRELDKCRKKYSKRQHSSVASASSRRILTFREFCCREGAEVLMQRQEELAGASEGAQGMATRPSIHSNVDVPRSRLLVSSPTPGLVANNRQETPSTHANSSSLAFDQLSSLCDSRMSGYAGANQAGRDSTRASSFMHIDKQHKSEVLLGGYRQGAGMLESSAQDNQTPAYGEKVATSTPFRIPGGCDAEEQNEGDGRLTTAVGLDKAQAHQTEMKTETRRAASRGDRGDQDKAAILATLLNGDFESLVNVGRGVGVGGSSGAGGQGGALRAVGAKVAKGVGWGVTNHEARHEARGVTNHQARPVPLVSTNVNAALDVLENGTAYVQHGIALSSAIGHAGTNWAGEEAQAQGRASFPGSSAPLSHSSSVEGSVQEASDASGSTGARHRSVSLSCFFVLLRGLYQCGMRGGFVVVCERAHYTDSRTTNLC